MPSSGAKTQGRGPAWSIAAMMAVILHLWAPQRHAKTTSIEKSFMPRQGEALIPLGARRLPAGDPKAHYEELIDPQPGTAMVHVASLCELPGGKLGAAWYGGTREGHQDVAIYLSTKSIKEPGGWTSPRPVVTRESAMRELRRYVRKVGNAVVFADAESGLWLVYVSVAAGGWSGSSLNVKRSFDQGETWTPSRRLTLSPFCNISELVKNKPVPLQDGGWALPIYHEAFGKFPELLWLHDTQGEVEESKTRMFGGRTAIQPSVVPFDDSDIFAFFRPVDGSHAILRSRSHDDERFWSAPDSTGLPNPDSGLDALPLSDGRVLLAFNDSAAGRENLKLALGDGGTSWSMVATLENEPGQEFSYPYLIQTGDGLVHVVYTWKRKAIKHQAFSVAWLESRIKDSAP